MSLSLLGIAFATLIWLGLFWQMQSSFEGFVEGVKATFTVQAPHYQT